MKNSIADMKKRVGVTADTLEILEDGALEATPASGMSAFEFYLKGLADDADELMAQWLETTVEALPTTAKILQAEINLVRAQICMDHGFLESILPDEVQAGGTEGIRVKNRRLSVEERGFVASEIRTRTRTLLTGKQPVGFSKTV